MSKNQYKISGIEAANVINKYFCAIGKSLADKIPYTDQQFKLVRSDCKFEWSQEISQAEVLLLIQKLDIKKSSGIPNIGSRLLKECL